MVQFADVTVWIVSFLFIIAFTLIVGIYLIRKGVRESNKKFMELGIGFIIALIVVLFVFLMLFTTRVT